METSWTPTSLRELHNRYQDAYANACWRSQLVARELRFKGGTYHRDGRPVTLGNDDTGAWEAANALLAELTAARAEHRAENPAYYAPNPVRAAESEAGRVRLHATLLTRPPVGWGSTMIEPDRTEAWQRRPAQDRLSDLRPRG